MPILTPDDAWMRVAHALDRFVLSTARSSWSEFRHEAAKQERRLLEQTPSKVWKLEIQRRFASQALLKASEEGVSWVQMKALLKRADSLGFSNVAHRLLTALALVAWSVRMKRGRAQAEHALRTVEQHVKRSDEPAETRERMLRTITEQRARLLVAFDGNAQGH
jgi:hypothetical protein